ncbi:predicted protein [Chaetoceros tenuissimus]|uniref:Uncharacterized protein n=1 Tax=Chaetoceros tenuissimus TaxID=426638 RepID=A0AAD3D4V9_9STRA|nr:predicted protein [Chaetoceros tenuissimus]
MDHLHQSISEDATTLPFGSRSRDTSPPRPSRGYVPQTKSRSNVFLEYRQNQELTRESRDESIYTSSTRDSSLTREDARAQINRKNARTRMDREMIKQLRQDKEDKYYRAVALGLRDPIPGHSEVKLNRMKKKLEKEGGLTRAALVKNRLKERKSQMEDLKESIRQLETHAKSTRELTNARDYRDIRLEQRIHATREEKQRTRKIKFSEEKMTRLEQAHAEANREYVRVRREFSTRSARSNSPSSRSLRTDEDEPWDPLNDMRTLHEDFMDAVNGVVQTISDMGNEFIGPCTGGRDYGEYSRQDSKSTFDSSRDY